MNDHNFPTEKKKRRKLSAEKMAELVLEAERIGASKICVREKIAPAQLTRWKKKFLQGGINGLKELKAGPKQKENPEIIHLKAEAERLKMALVETSIELSALKKSVI
jgi:transposase-like protein